MRTSDWSGQWLMASYFSLFGHKRVWLVSSVEKYWARDTRAIKVRRSSHPSHSSSWPIPKSLRLVTWYRTQKIIWVKWSNPHPQRRRRRMSGQVMSWSIILWMMSRRPSIPLSTREGIPARKRTRRRRPRNPNQVNPSNSVPLSLWKPFIKHWKVKSTT